MNYNAATTAEKANYWSWNRAVFDEGYALRNPEIDIELPTLKPFSTNTGPSGNDMEKCGQILYELKIRDASTLTLVDGVFPLI